MIDLPDPLLAPLALILVAGSFVAFLLERYPPEVTAAGAAALFVLLGMVPTEMVLSVFANPAPITIAAMFVTSGALVRTGLLDALAGQVIGLAEHRPRLALGLFLGAALVASGFVNNTPVVLILIPAMIRLARSLGIPATRLLIPLSYVSVMGGTLTLIGTSTNLLVAGVAGELGIVPFDLFEITPVALAAAAAGLPALLLLGPLLLPQRGTGDGMEETEATYVTDLRIGPDYAHLETPLGEVADLTRDGVRVTGLRSGGTILRKHLTERPLEAGDILVAQVRLSELLTLRNVEGIKVGLTRRSAAAGQAEDPVVAEAIVTPAAGRSGRTRVTGLGLERHGLRVLGAHRHGHHLGPDLPSARLRPADTVLLEGPEAGFEKLAQQDILVAISRPAVRGYRRRRAPLALAALVAVVVLSALGIASIAVVSLVAVAAILILRCIDSDEAWGSIDAGILVLIFSMLIVGLGLQETGAVALIVEVLGPLLSGLPPIAMLAAVYLLTSVLTETVTNNAVAVVVTPVAIALTPEMGLDPRPFVVAVMMGASASFATPVGYQTNTLVYGAGDYRFADFLRIGVPMNLIVGAAAVIAIPIVFPL